MYKSLLDLQKLQYQHDKNYHVDIFNLPTQEKLKHYVLHLAKYAGNIYEGDFLNIELFIVDIFIIGLAIQNLLGKEGFITCDFTDTFLDSKIDFTFEYARSFIIDVGGLAKACGALNHFENYDSRYYVNFHVRRILNDTYWLSIALKFDLEKAVKSRWAGIEAKNIFNGGKNNGQDIEI